MFAAVGVAELRQGVEGVLLWAVQPSAVAKADVLMAGRALDDKPRMPLRAVQWTQAMQGVVGPIGAGPPEPGTSGRSAGSARARAGTGRLVRAASPVMVLVVHPAESSPRR